MTCQNAADESGTGSTALDYVSLLSCSGVILRFGRQARLGEHGASGATTKAEVAANRYRDFGRDNSLQGLMLTHRPCELSRLKACGFCHTLRHETPYGVTKRHEKCNIGEALYNLRRESVLEL